MNVSVSITDSPFLTPIEDIFSGLKEAGADGVEIVTGIKSRWRWKQLAKYAEKYNLPIMSVHQPPWSLLNIFFDEENVKETVDIGVKTFVFHPLPKFSFKDREMQLYLEKLAYVQDKYHVRILFENMPAVIRAKFAEQLMPFSDDMIDIPLIIKNISTYGLGFNFDTAHAYSVEPQKEPWFDTMYPLMGNIHLSSFSDKKDHLPLYMGMFNTPSFIQALEKRKYKGLVTFEIFYPGFVRMAGYDFSVMKKSIDIVKSATHSSRIAAEKSLQ